MKHLNPEELEKVIKRCDDYKRTTGVYRCEGCPLCLDPAENRCATCEHELFDDIVVDPAGEGYDQAVMLKAVFEAFLDPLYLDFWEATKGVRAATAHNKEAAYEQDKG